MSRKSGHRFSEKDMRQGEKDTCAKERSVLKLATILPFDKMMAVNPNALR
jgi:hypothetical protein